MAIPVLVRIGPLRMHLILCCVTGALTAALLLCTTGCGNEDASRAEANGKARVTRGDQEGEGGKPGQPTAAEAQVSLRLKWVFDPGFGGELVAKSRGFFREHGLDLSIEPGGFEADPIKLVASGSNTFGVAGADSFLIARAKGVPIVAFAAGYIETPVVFYAKKSSRINSPQQFVGKKVGIQAGQDTETVFRAMLGGAGVTESQMTLVPVKYDFALFLQDAVEVWPGYAATQSFTLVKEGIPYSVIRPADYGVSYLGTVYFATATTIKDHPDWVQGFVDALVKGWESTYGDEAASIATISAYDQKALSTDYVRFALAKQLPFIRPAGSRFCELDMARLKTTQDILVNQHLLSQPLDLSAATDLRFLEKHYKSHK